MLKDRNVLCISGTEWHGNYIKPLIELMKVLSTDNKILFVDNAYTYKDALLGVNHKSAVDFKQVFGVKSRLKELTLENGGKVYWLTPPLTFPVSFLSEGKAYDVAIRYNAWLLRRVIKKNLHKLGMNSDLINFTSFNPAMGVMNGRKFGEKSLIYHCYDEIKGANEWLRKHGSRMEDEFLKMADATIVSSKGLYDSKAPFTKRCFVVKNAAKADLFNKGFAPVINSGKINVGYIGTIDDRQDYDLITHLIKNMPDADFTFVGRVLNQKGANLLKSFPNVTLVGAKQQEELPGVLRKFSVGIIPFVKNKLTSGIYPMKMNEYLGAGLPVVSTDFSTDMADFEGTINITANKEQFLEAVKFETTHNTPEKQQARLALAGKNTWVARAQELSDAIEQTEHEIYGK
ncbi:glycosyltransferase [Mucilaginibacter glaciei]|uniref:Glycosyltransferase n=1 Tax=Mucilaginibacter glaciei TaxID=2772109 RepID=A0A926P0B5_9SPHI|nr:glycosyltransferase [Mucilaginibacter glaciei]MBD1395278.1 glycosyltransferase [Mucilaginibacter glaciei]